VPCGIEADAQVLEQSLQLMLLKERPGSFHLFVAAGTEFRVDSAQDRRITVRHLTHLPRLPFTLLIPASGRAMMRFTLNWPGVKVHLNCWTCR